MVCPRCGIARLVEIDLKLREQSVVMTSCSECGTRWDEGGRNVGLSGFLELVAASR